MLKLAEGQQIIPQFRFIANANRYIHTRYGIPFTVIPYVF